MRKQKHKFQYICFLLLFFLCSVKGMAANYYWVGGDGNWNDVSRWRTTSGGTSTHSVVPGPADDVFFDDYSGGRITISSPAFAHDITFSGDKRWCFLTGAELNIFGSSVWASGLHVSVKHIFYRNSGEAKTIKSGGVFLRTSYVHFEEESSISLLDDFSVNHLQHDAGVWNTNDYKVTLRQGYYSNTSLKTRVLNMGSSEFYISENNAEFNAGSPGLTVNSGTSLIRFAGMNPVFRPYKGHVYNNIIFQDFRGAVTFGDSQESNAYFNRVEFVANGNFIKDNQIKELILNPGKTYTLDAGSTQTVTERLETSGNPCLELSLKSSVPGTKANLHVLGGSTRFNFVNIQDIQASGLPLHFGSKSTNAGNNSNMTFDPYNPGSFSGFEGQNWGAAQFNNNDPASYTLSASGFYGNRDGTTYTWSKIGDPAHPGTISHMTSSIDMRAFGYGTYHVKVSYSTGNLSNSCMVEESITVKQFYPSIINPGMPKRNH